MRTLNAMTSVNEVSGVTVNPVYTKATAPQIPGINWFQKMKMWKIEINAGGTTKHLGYTSDFIDAVKIRRNAELQYNWKGQSIADEFLASINC